MVNYLERDIVENFVFTSDPLGMSLDMMLKGTMAATTLHQTLFKEIEVNARVHADNTRPTSSNIAEQ